MISLTELKNKLLAEESVAIFCHVRPDGDTLGSALALKLALQSLNIRAEVYCDDIVPARFFFLEETKTVKKDFINDYSALLAIDRADITRLGDFNDAFLAFKNTYIIDHHISNTRFAKTNYVFDRASNSENVLELIKLMGAKITKEMANLLAMGIMTDTGAFKHKNVTKETLFSAGELIELGADTNSIYYNMFTKQTAERAKLFGLTTSNIRYFHNKRFAVITISKKNIEIAGAKPEDTEGFIDFIMGIESVEIGASVLEMDKNKYKISFRSKGADVNALAGAFGGGGHTLASGCQLHGEYEEVIDKIQFEASRHLID